MKPLILGIFAAAAAVLSSSVAFADGSALKTVNPGKLTVAYRTDDRPVSFIDPDGKPSGFLVDFENAAGKKLGLDVEYVSTDFASMVPAVRNNRYDTAAFQVLVTPERQASVDFTSATGYSEARLVSLKSKPIDKVDGAKDKTVAITRGSALIPQLQTMAPGVAVREFPNIAASLNALLAGQVDGLFTGLNTADELVQKHSDLTASQVVTTGMAAFPISKDNPELKKAMDGAITALMEDGTYTTLFTKWYPPSVEIPEKLFTDYPGMPRPAKK